MTPAEIAALLRDQLAEQEDGAPVVLTRELDGVADVLDAYLPDRDGLEIAEPQIAETADGVVVSGYAAVFGLPPVRTEVRFAVDGEEVALTIAIRPEMGVTAGGLFPELSGSGLWLPLASLAITLRSADADARTFAISAIVSPDLDELLRPLIHLLEGVAGFDGEGTIGPDGVLQKLRLGSKLIHAEVGPVKLDGNLALVAEDAGGGQVRSALAIEGTMTVALGARSITAGFQLTPARPDQAFHVLVARIAEGDTLDAPALGLPLPAGLPATLRLESLEVLLGAISGVPEEIAIHAALDGELHLIPLPVAIERLTGIFTIWPTATPVGGRAQLAGRVALGGSDMDFTLDIPEMDFAVTADPATTPNVKQLVEGLVGAPLPGGFPDLAITELGITGNSTRGQYQLRLRLAGEWSLKPLIGLDLALRSIRIAGQAQTTGAAVQRTGSITGAIHLGSPDDGAGVIELGAELTASGQWVLRGGLAAGSTLSLPQLVSVIGVAPSSMPGDLRSVVIDALAVSLDTGSGQASFAAAAGFSLALPFGLSSLSLHGGVTLAREGRDHAWQGEATAEVSFRSLRLRVAFPIDRAEVDPRFSLWLPRPGNPDDGQWLDCVVTKDASGAIKTLGFTLTTMNVFAAIEAFVNLMVPGLTIQFPWPWGELEKIPLPPTHVTIDPGEMSVALAITSGFGVINDIPGIHIDSVALALDLDDAKAALEVVGEFFGERYTPDEPLSWDPVTEDPPTPPLLPDLGFELRYLGLGRHVTLGDLSGVRHVRDAIELLRGAFDEDPRGGGAGLSKLRYSSESEWLVGLDFSVSGFLRLRMIFNDPYLYGLAIGLDGAAAGLFAGLEFEILYRRIGPGLGVYSIELELPPFMRIIELGAVTIALPVVAVDIYTNGNFKIDFGFPYGGDFARSFYISMIPFAGAGGFYYASLNGATSTSVPRITNGTFEPVIELGLGLTVGIGKRLGSGSFRLEVYVGVMAILEGVFATFQPYDPGASSATFFRITGMFRIVALVEGMVDFKIIAVSFSITLWVGATIRVQCYEPILLDVSASVSVRASIKIGWFRISFSFSASVSLSFSLGSRSATPWIVGDGPARARLARGGRARPPRPARMLASSDLAAGPSFDWTRGVPGRAKVALDWHVYFAVGVDLDRSTEGGGRIPVAVPLAGFFEETGGAGAHGATRWLERVFHWLLCAWHGTLPATTRFADARALDVELQDRGAAGRIGWSELSAFLEQNFTIALAPKPEPAAGSSFSVSMVPLPPVLELVFTVPGLEERRLDLSAGPLIGEDVLAGVARRGGRYARRPPPEAATSAGGAVAPMAEWLWKDVMTMQVKELATRLLKLMQACPVTVDEHDGFASIGDLYDRLVYDPDLSDAERRPFFEDFVVANVARAGLMRVDAELVIPRDGADDHDRVAVGDTLESIATRNGVTPADLVEANLDADVLAAGGTWIIPSIVELPVDDAWRRLVEAGAPADLAAMTSRFLLHGTRLDVGGAAINLYEAAGLQFDLPATEATGAPPPKLRVVHAAGSPGAGWLSLDSLEIELGPNERGSLDRLLGDPAFEPKARVTGMAITQEVAVELGLARAIPVRRARDDGGDAEPDGQIRLLPRAFFDLLAQRAAQGLPPVEGWRAHPGRRSTGAAAAVDELAYEWTTRLDVDVSRLGKDEALAGRTVYRITGLEPEARLRLHRLLGDLQRGAAQATVVPAVGVAGPASASGGLIAGRPDAAAIVLFRNDADDRPETPARADNRTQAAFLQLLAESVAEEPGTFFFADVLPGVKGVDDAIFAGGEKGVITLLIHLSGDADLTRYADGIHVAALDPGSTVVRLSAPGLTEKVAHVPPDQLQFRIERPEPHEDDADALESLYSLVSFSFAAADGSDPSPASLPLGPRSETEGFWLYEQTVPFAAAFATREERPPYADVGKTRSLRLAWRDIFGNEAIQAGARFAGRSTPAAAFAADLAALPLSCFYYDDLVPVSRWPGVQASHRFAPGPGGAELVVQLAFDPTFLQSGADPDRVAEDLARIADQLADDRVEIRLQTSLEAAAEAPAPAELRARKARARAFVAGLRDFLDQARTLRRLEIRPGPDRTIAALQRTWGLDARELARAVRAVPLGALLAAPDAGVSQVRVPRRWQTGADSLTSIAVALGVDVDVVVASLVRHHGDERGLLADRQLDWPANGSTLSLSAQQSIADAAAAMAVSPHDFLLELAAVEGLLAAARTVHVADTLADIRVDDTLGELAVRVANHVVGGPPTSGFALSPSPEEIIAASGDTPLRADVLLLLEDRVVAPAAVSGAAWRRVVASSPASAAGALGMSPSAFVTLNARRADLVESGVAVTWTTDAHGAITVTTTTGDTFAALRRRLEDAAGESMTGAGFATAIADGALLRSGVDYLVPPAPVAIARTVAPRATPAAFELDASLVVQRFPLAPAPADLDLVHPDLRDRAAVWFAPSTTTPAAAGAESTVATLRPYAEAFEQAFAAAGLHVALGAGRSGARSSIWIVRLGPGGFDFAVAANRPAFLSLRPLSTAPLYRKKLPLYRYAADRRNLRLDVPDDALDVRNFAAIDLDDWARRALGLIDRILRPASALALSEIGVTAAGHRYDDLLAARAALAGVLVRGLTEIIDYPDAEPAQSGVTRRLMKERIGNQLASAYDVDAVTLFPLHADGEPFTAHGVFLETGAGPRDTGYRFDSTQFASDDDWLVMAVDVVRPEEHRVIETRAAFQITTLELTGSGDDLALSFVMPPAPYDLGALRIPIPLRDLPTAPELRRQQGVPDFEVGADGYPRFDSFDDLMMWRYEVDYVAGFAEQDTHTLELFFNLGADEELPRMMAGYDGRLFQDLFHALAQCDATLELYAAELERRVKDKFAAGNLDRKDLHWILDDLIVLVDELAHHWGQHYDRGGPSLPMTTGNGLKKSMHRYQLAEQRETQVDAAGHLIRDDLRFVLTCTTADPVPVVRVGGAVGQVQVDDRPDGRRNVVVTLPDWFRGRDSAELHDLPRTLGFRDLHVLERQNVRCRIKTTRNAELLEGARTAEAFIYRTPVVTLPDRFFPSVAMEERVHLSRLFDRRFAHPTDLLAALLHDLLGLGIGRQHAGLRRRLSLTVRYGFALTGDWSDRSSFAGETPIFFEPRLILDHVPAAPGGDDPISKLGDQMQRWLLTSGARRDNAGFVIGIDVFTDEALNPYLVDPTTSGRAAADDARLIRLTRLEADFPDS